MRDRVLLAPFLLAPFLLGMGLNSWLATAAGGQEPGIGAIVFADQLIQLVPPDEVMGRDSYRHDLHVRLEDLLRNCDLSEAQQKKLSVGVEGLVEKLGGDAVHVVVARKNAGLVFQQGQVVEVGAIIGQIRPVGNIQRRPRMAMLWNELVDKILDDEQEKAWKVALERRVSRSRKAGVDLLVTQVDMELRLDDEQLDKVRELADRYVGSVFEKGARHDKDIPVTKSLFSKVPAQLMEEILTKHQMGKYKSLWPSGINPVLNLNIRQAPPRFDLIR
jgi:hypothetical protein